MPGSVPTESNVREFVYDWFRMLDAHVNFEEYIPLLSDTDAVMVFPEATLKGAEAFSA